MINQTGKFEMVDFLRGWSIFTISLMHLVMPYFDGVLFKASLFGGAGVHVFILCSGFGLYLSYLKQPANYWNFLKRRFSKVWIPYTFVVVFLGLWFLATSGHFPMREVASHLFLYKMFSNELDTSLCYTFWFISTIIQFYLFWPLIVKIIRLKWGGLVLLMLSLSWSTIVGLLGLEEERPWGSFFLQYLWEFGLGMWIAERIYEGRSKMIDIKEMKWWWLLIGAIVGMGLSAVMAWNGGWLKLYNDIPSLIGYLSVALIIYKVGVSFVNRFFEWTNRFSYELYLLHPLVFTVVFFYLESTLPLVVLLALSFIAAYIFAYCYNIILKEMYLKA